MMRFLIARAVNPDISLQDSLRRWNQIADELREPPRNRPYQQDKLEQLLT